MICGVGRVGGLYAGFVINRQGLVGDPSIQQSSRRGALYRANRRRSARSRAHATPTVCRSSGCRTSAASTSARRPSDKGCSPTAPTSSTRTARTPRRCSRCLLRQGIGRGLLPMAGLPYDPVVQLSTCLSRQSVMEGRTLAIATYNTKLDDDFHIVAKDEAERQSIREGMQRVEQRIEADMDHSTRHGSSTPTRSCQSPSCAAGSRRWWRRATRAPAIGG